MYESVKHSAGEYVRDQAHTKGIEYFRAMLNRAHTGTFHSISYKHSQRYIDGLSGRHNLRHRRTLAHMAAVVAFEVGHRMSFAQLTGRSHAKTGFFAHD